METSEKGKQRTSGGRSWLTAKDVTYFKLRVTHLFSIILHALNQKSFGENSLLGGAKKNQFMSLIIWQYTPLNADLRY